MFENTLDKYAHSNNLKNTNTYFKVLFAILTMIMSLISTSPIIPLTITFLMSFLIIFKANIPWKFYLKFLLVVPVAFGLLTFVFMAIFFGVGNHVLELGIFNLAITSDGFNLGLLVFARMLGGFSCLAFLALTTPMNELFSVMESFKIPKIVLEIAMLMYRYIFVFLNEANNMYHAQETRLGYSGLKKTYKSMGMLASNLFIKTWVKGEKAYLAMESRCYDGSIRMLKNKESIRQVSTKNLLLLVIFEAFLFLGTYITGAFKVF
jgi:cobalt/nickel transport system permease protein